MLGIFWEGRSMAATHEDAESGTLAGRMVEALHELGRLSVGDSLSIMNESGLTLPQLIALHVLRGHGARSVGELAGCTRLSMAATSHLVDRLVRLGLVHRAEDPDDRRQKRVTVSRAGAALAERLENARLTGFAGAFDRLRPATRSRLKDVLDAVLHDLRAEADR